MTAWVALAGLDADALHRAARRRAPVLLADGTVATLVYWPTDACRSPLVLRPTDARARPVLASTLAGIDADHALLPHRPRRSGTRRRTPR